MKYINKRIAIIANDKATYNLAILSQLMNGYDYVKGTAITTVDENGIIWYRSTLIRKKDMIFKIFGI